MKHSSVQKKSLFKNLLPDLIAASLIVILSIILIFPYFKSGYFPTHDGEWAVVRLSEMFREVKDLQFPPRFSNALNNGYGYPLFNFAYPFPYYFGLIFKFIGFDFIQSVKIVFALSVPLSGISMYLFSRNLWKSRIGGLFSALLYMFVPYRMVDLYVRGSIGESLAFALIPFLLFFIIGIKDSPRLKFVYTALASFLLGALILNHNIMAVYYVPIAFLVGILCILFYDKKLWPYYISILLLGIGISSFFWFPALFEKNNILLSIIPIADRDLYFVTFQKLIFPSWGYEIPTDNTSAFSYQLGIGTIATIILTVGYFIFELIQKRKFSTESKLGVVFLIVLIGMIFLMFEQSNIIWESLPMLKEINYPWTLLAPISLVGAILAGFVVSRNKTLLYVSATLILINGIFIIRYAKPILYSHYDEGYYSTNQATTTSSSELMPLWVKEFPKTSPKEKVEIIKGKGKIENIQLKSNKVSFNTELPQEAVVRINTVFYPGWRIFVNNTMTNFYYNNMFGVMDIKLPSGEHEVSAKFVETKPRLMSDLVSVFSVCITAGLFLFGIFYVINYHGKKQK